MSYTPTEWATGDTVTAEKLNKIEQGVKNASGAKIEFVTLTYSSGAYHGSKTVSEMVSALNSGTQFVLQISGNVYTSSHWTNNSVYFTCIYAEPSNDYGITNCSISVWKASNSSGSDVWTAGDSTLQLSTT